MFVECPTCGNRYEIDQSRKKYEIVCECSERIAVLPCASHRQNVTEPGEVECSECRRKFDLKHYRNDTEIACTCGNLLAVNCPEAEETASGRRKSDHMSEQLQTRLHGLVDTCRLIHFIRDTDQLLLLIVRVTTAMLDSEGCSVILRDPESQDLVFHSVTGTKSSDLTQFRLAEGEGVAGQSIQNRQSIVANDVANDARFSKRADDTSGFSTRNLLCIPLIVEEKCIGALEIVNKKNDADFTEEDLILSDAVANQIAVAIHNVQLTEAALKAERLAAIGQAVTGVAHCVKNMLNGLDGGLYVLESDIEEVYGKTPKRGFEMLGRNIDRLKDLVQDMLTYSKERQPEYSLVNLNDLIDSVVELTVVKARERNVALSFVPDPEIGDIILDHTGIYRCVLNLVSNAIDACETGGEAVTVSTRTSDSKYAVIAVQDQGSGMDQETLESIFQLFFSRKGSKGTGLGLPVTQKIIQEHGGRIEVDSLPGRGSTFTVFLPLEYTPAPEPVATPARDRTASTPR
jgi:signal transduction histidine kinase